MEKKNHEILVTLQYKPLYNISSSEKWGKKIQAMAYNGVHAVIKDCLFVFIITASKKIYLFRQGTAKFSPQNINPYLCTHLIYAFAGLGKDDEIQTFDKYQDLEKGKVS